MKKLFLACTAIIGICTFSQIADAYPYYHRHFYGRHGYPIYGRGYYGGYGFYGPRRFFVNDFYFAPPLLPPPVYYCPPPRPVYYEGRVRRDDYQPRPRETEDNSK